MSINSVGGVTSQNVYKTYAGKSENSGSKEIKNTAAGGAAESSGVVYESSKEVKEVKKYTPNTELVNKMKADTEARASQLRTLVEQMMSKQGNAYGAANDIWKFLAEGKFTVDPSVKLQAQQDIAEDGYWGVNQTSDRIIEFATALTGGDPSKVEAMREAFQKGYDMATQKWGGELPELSQKTYDAVMEKFDKLAGKTPKTAE